jgi:hypothetical protein
MEGRAVSVSLKYSHIEKIEGEPARLERLPRIRVALIAVDYLEHGWSVDEMCRRHHPYLSLAGAHAAMAYYFDHEAEVESDIKEEIILRHPLFFEAANPRTPT